MSELERLLELSLLIPQELHDHYKQLLKEGFSLDQIEELFRGKS